MTTERKALCAPMLILGSDPEVFFTRRGEVIGAERVIPADGLKGPLGYSTVVIDGVQAELHLIANTGCRESMAYYLQDGFKAIQKRLDELGDPDVKLSFRSHFTVPREELDSLSDACKMLGCQPSLNTYGFQDLGVDVGTFLERSAGGHLHFGLPSDLRIHAAECVPVLDAVLGNFCVMVDRDPYAAARRNVYGRAGEHRLPMYGLEYRTLSNFWLHAYPLQSMVMGIARWALGLCYTSELHQRNAVKNSWDPVKILLGEYVDPSQVQRAINENNLTLAKENWAGLKRFVNEHVEGHTTTGINPELFPLIEHFLHRIEASGLGYWFTQDPLEHWLSLRIGNEVTGYEKTVPFYGWESFLTKTVAHDRKERGKVVAA